MGGASSQPIAAPEQEETVFSLSSEVQERMAQDFNNEQIAKLFGRQMEKLAERNVQQRSQMVQQRSKIEEHMTQFREQDNKRQKQLDEKIESFEDRFTDASNIVEYDMARLEKKYLSERKQGERPACLPERVDVASCYKSNSGRHCDIFVENLALCVEKSLAEMKAVKDK